MVRIQLAPSLLPSSSLALPYCLSQTEGRQPVMARRQGTGMDTWSRGTHRHEAPLESRSRRGPGPVGLAAAETAVPQASLPLHYPGLSGPRGAHRAGGGRPRGRFSQLSISECHQAQPCFLEILHMLPPGQGRLDSKWACGSPPWSHLPLPLWEEPPLLPSCPQIVTGLAGVGAHARSAVT